MVDTALFLDCEQGSKAWFEARLGSVTSSRIADVVAKRKAKAKEGEKVEELKCTGDMRWELVLELLTGKPTEHYVSRWMTEGKIKEPFARTEYEIRNARVQTVGFVYHPTIKMAGSSPDGVTRDGLIEIKCPKLETHLGYILADKIPDQYLPQLLWQMACVPDAEYNDFVSFYCPLPEDDERFSITLPDSLCLFQKRLQRTDEVQSVIEAMEAEVEMFNATVQQSLSALQAKLGLEKLEAVLV